MKRARQDCAASAGRRPAAGFTLLEILIAIVIGATLLTAAINFALSMGELWGAGSEVRLFDQHVRGVTRFLENILAQAEPPPTETEGGSAGQPGIADEATRAGGNQNNEEAAPVIWEKPRSRQLGGDELLTFELAESPGVFAWPEQPLPFVVCSLRLDPREGLFLLWKSRIEVDFADGEPRALRLSPFVTAINYFYYEASTTGARSSWEQTDQPRTATGGGLEVPQRVRLTFEYKGMTRTTELVIPGAATTVPLY